MILSARPNPKEHPTMYKAWRNAEIALGEFEDDIRERAAAALEQPDNSLRDMKRLAERGEEMELKNIYGEVIFALKGAKTVLELVAGAVRANKSLHGANLSGANLIGANRWFHDIVMPRAREIRFIRGRLKFGDAVNSAPFPSMVVVFGQ